MPADIFGHVPSPPGTIAYWDDDPANLPAGWVICDGNNGTPDLLDEFVKNVPDASTEPGAVGGQNSFSITESQMASHEHSTGGTGSTGSHTHKFSFEDHTDFGNAYNETDGTGSNASVTISQGNHSHSIDDGNIGSSNSVDNQPKYYEAVPVMKT